MINTQKYKLLVEINNGEAINIFTNLPDNVVDCLNVQINDYDSDTENSVDNTPLTDEYKCIF